MAPGIVAVEGRGPSKGVATDPSSSAFVTPPRLKAVLCSANSARLSTSLSLFLQSPQTIFRAFFSQERNGFSQERNGAFFSQRCSGNTLPCVRGKTSNAKNLRALARKIDSFLLTPPKPVQSPVRALSLLPQFTHQLHWVGVFLLQRHRH